MSNRDSKKWRHWQESDARRQLQKQIKRNRQPGRTRRKDWQSIGDDEWEMTGTAGREQIMPRGERERRRMVAAAAETLLERQQDELSADLEDQPALRTGVVVSVSTGSCEVVLGGKGLLCSLRGSLSAGDTGFTNVVAVGDRVVITEDGTGRGVVETVLPRRSVLTRPDVFYEHLQQVIVANADQLLIVAAWRDPVIWMELIDRLLITAERHRLVPVVCVNKLDLADNPAEPQEVLRPYLDLGYHVLFTSVPNHQGVDRLRRALRNRTTAVAGMSGVGKSSLLNAVQPGLQIRVSEVSEWRGEGRHTTSQVRLATLDGGGYVVDTPGIREFGLAGLTRADLVGYYPEMVPLARNCRFRDCSHTHEPGCAIRAAAGAKTVSPVRYHNYVKIYGDLSS